MKKILKNKIYIFLIGLVIGFLLSQFQKPEKVEVEETISSQKKTISDLKSKIESLKKENLKENVKTVVIERPDGTKITTKTRATEKTTTTAELSKKEESSKSESALLSDKKTTTTFSSKRSSIGVRPVYTLPKSFDVESYIKAGMDCFIFNCYAQGSYYLISKEPSVSVGIEYRF